MDTDLYSPLSRQDHIVILYPSETSSRAILQTSSHVLFSFNANGVQVLHPSSFVVPVSAAYQNTWALVDINLDVQTPAEMRRDNSPFFLVIACSPRASRWQGVLRDRGLVTFWLMRPFTLAELIQASVFLASISSFATYVIFQLSTSTS